MRADPVPRYRFYITLGARETERARLSSLRHCFGVQRRPTRSQIDSYLAPQLGRTRFIDVRKSCETVCYGGLFQSVSRSMPRKFRRFVRPHFEAAGRFITDSRAR